MLRRSRGTYSVVFASHAALAAAMVVDGVGTGLFLPFAIVYFLHTTTISLDAIGASLSLAALIALPTPLLVGPLIDRYGPGPIVVCGNTFSAAGFVGYLAVESTWQLIVAALVVGVGQATFWTATRSLVAVVARPQHRAHWFALQTVTRNAGYGAGAVIGAAIIAGGTSSGYHLLAAANAASFLIAGGLIARAHIPRTGPADPTSLAGSHLGRRARSGYRTFIFNPTLLTLGAINIVFVLSNSVLSVLMAVYLTRVLHVATWVSGALFAAETVLVIAAQASITTRANRYSSPAVLKVAAVTYAFAFALLWALSAAPGWLLAAGLVVFLAAFALAGMLQGPVINTLATDTAPPLDSGKYLALYQLSWSIGGGIAPALLTSLLSANASLPWITLISGCIAASAALNSNALRRQPNPDPTTQST